jgi:dTDP-D-glucose 4,6-dehydratase
VRTICAILDKVVEQKPGNISQFADLITFVKDRPGHDLRYAIDAAKFSATWAGSRKKRLKVELKKRFTGI